MSLDSDALLDRINLKKKVTKWQLIALIIAILAIVFAIDPKAKFGSEIDQLKEEYIARVKIEGIIASDSYRSRVLRDLADNEKAKAVIIEIDSPGGTTAGGEDLYFEVRKLSESGKPVVVVMKTLATSAGYLTAIAGDHIIARNGTITGSIGVIVQSAEATELAEKLGLKFHTFKSAPLKANPSPFEKLQPGAKEAMQAVVMSFYNYFVDLVAQRREMDRDKVVKLADGRIYTGKQALENGLIDQIGGQDEALKWLQTEQKISDKLEVEDISVVKKEDSLAQVLFGSITQNEIFSKMNLNGALSIWYPEMQ